MSLFDDTPEEIQDENLDSQNTETEEELDIDFEPEEESKEEEKKDDSSDELARLKEQNAKLYARLKKTEQKVKETPGTAGSGDNSQTVDLDVLEFFSKGNTKEDYRNALAIMKGKGLTFEQALIDPLYVAHKQVAEAKAKRTASQLGASRSGGVAKQEGVKPGMTTEEHKALAMKAMGL
jgi:hypothetical protein